MLAITNLVHLFPTAAILLRLIIDVLLLTAEIAVHVSSWFLAIHISPVAGCGRDMDLRKGDCDQVGGRHPGVQAASQEQGHEGAEEGREGRAPAAEREQVLEQQGKVVMMMTSCPVA